MSDQQEQVRYFLIGAVIGLVMAVVLLVMGLGVYRYHEKGTGLGKIKGIARDMRKEKVNQQATVEESNNEWGKDY